MQNIHIGIDESGTSVYNDKENIFVLAAVVFTEEYQYQKVCEYVKNINLKRNKKELKYSKSDSKFKNTFIKDLQKIKHKCLYFTKSNDDKKIINIYRLGILEIFNSIINNYTGNFFIKIDAIFSRKVQSIYIKEIKSTQ